MRMLGASLANKGMMGHEDAKNKSNTKDPHLNCKKDPLGKQEKNFADVATLHKHIKGLIKFVLMGVK